MASSIYYGVAILFAIAGGVIDLTSRWRESHALGSREEANAALAAAQPGGEPHLEADTAPWPTADASADYGDFYDEGHKPQGWTGW